MPDMKSKILDWSKVKKWVDDTFSLNTHDHDDKYAPLVHTHDDAIYGSMPDFSRAVSIGAQEGWKSTTKECYNEPGTNNTVLGGCPYVLKCVTPCYIYLTEINAGSTQDDDSEWAIWFGANREHVICCNKADGHDYHSIIARLTAANGFTGLQMGVNFFAQLHGNAEADSSGYTLFPMSMKNWWYRPMIGGGGSDNENWEYWDFKLVPCVGTPVGTVLAERYQFTADNSKSSLLNTNPVYGTMNAAGKNVITYYNNNDPSKATASTTITRPGIIKA